MSNINPLVEKSAGVTAVAGSTAPTPLYGHFLTSNGILFLSYAEWIQVLGAIYVASLLIKAAKNGYQLLKEKITLRRNLGGK